MLIILLLPNEVQGLTNAVTEGVNDANLVVVLSQKTKLISGLSSTVLTNNFFLAFSII